MHVLGRFFATLTGLLCIASAHAQAFPSRPVTLIVPVPPGGILDYVARLVAPPLSKALGQPVVVENKSGASGNIAATYVARAKNDGYTMLVGYSMFHVGNPTMFSQLQWDPLRDFSSVAMLAVSPHLVAVHPSLPVNNLQDLVNYARANPGKVNYGTPGNGSVPHVGVELFKQLTKVNFTQVPYKGSGPMMIDVISGQVQMTVATPPSVMTTSPSFSDTRSATSELLPWAMLANGPPWMIARLFSSVCTRLGASASRSSAVMAPCALRSLAVTALPSRS